MPSLEKSWDVVLYHAVADGQPCTDGYTGYYVVRKAFPEIEGVPVVHGQPPPMDKIAGKRVVLVDFCYPRETMLELRKVTKDLLVLDHHKTALDQCGDLPYCRFDLSVSGAMLAWRYFFEETTGEKPPPLVSYVSDADLWKFKLKSSREIRAWLSSLPMDLIEWSAANILLRDSKAFEQVAWAGSLILRQIDHQVARAAETHTVVDTEDGQMAFVNSQLYQSEIGSKLAEKYGMACVWWYDRGLIRLSLRADAAHDVSLAAKALGGGGHPQAAGAALPGMLSVEENVQREVVAAVVNCRCDCHWERPNDPCSKCFHGNHQRMLA